MDAAPGANACIAPDTPPPADPLSDEDWVLVELHAAANSCTDPLHPDNGFSEGHGGVVWQYPPLDCVRSVDTMTVTNRLEDRTLHIENVPASGGCERLRHNLHWDGVVEPSGVEVVLTNAAATCANPCAASLEGSLEFDVGSIVDAWDAAGYQGVPQFRFVSEFTDHSGM
jgi:hypothetical protein